MNRKIQWDGCNSIINEFRLNIFWSYKGKNNSTFINCGTWNSYEQVRQLCAKLSWCVLRGQNDIVFRPIVGQSVQYFFFPFIRLNTKILFDFEKSFVGCIKMLSVYLDSFAHAQKRKKYEKKVFFKKLIKSFNLKSRCTCSTKR